jgi:hypothetical protein
MADTKVLGAKLLIILESKSMSLLVFYALLRAASADIVLGQV